MKIRIRLFIIVLLIMNAIVVSAQLQKVDTTFIINTGANNAIRNINIQNSGKIILTGEFNSYSGKPANRIVRLKTDGVLDTSFKAGLASEGPIRASALLPNDQLIIAGLFNSYNGIVRKNIAKINHDGTLDTSFAKGLGANNEITEMYLQNDGKLLITGFFNKYNNVSFNGFLRLKHDGEIDTTFKIGTGPNLSPYAMAQQSDSKIILVGSFVTYNGIPRNKIVHINLDGSLDTTFKNNSISGIIQRVLVLNNDEIIITGGFTNIDGVAKTGIAKLSKDGVLDVNYSTQVVGTIRGLHQQMDGKIIISGDFTNVNGVPVQRLARLNTDGTLDNNFYAGFNGTIYDIAEQSNKNIILVGNFSQTTEVPAFTRSTPKLVRLFNNYCLPPTIPKFNQNFIYACKGDSIEIKISEGELNGAQNWYWYTDSCTIATGDSGNNIFVKVNSSKTYFVRAENGCVSTNNPCVQFDVYMYDTINTSVTSSMIGLFAMDVNCTYQWYNCDPNFKVQQGETEQHFVPSINGNFAVVLTSANGCIDTSDCVFFEQEVFGIDQKKQLKIQNPVIENLIIPLSYDIVEVEIFSTIGQSVMFTTSNSSLTKIPLDVISKGIYLLKAKDKSNRIYVQRIIVL